MSQLENLTIPLDLRTQIHQLTVSASARREVLSRLLGLNHERWDEEQKAAEEVKDEKKKPARKKKSDAGQMGLL